MANPPPSAAEFEKLGLFYLGRLVDPATREPRPELLLYPSRHLLTHALVVGMTGSGKSGLGIALLEEAAIDGVPALIIDPKGDLGNLLFRFPDLAPEDFAPWIDRAAAAGAGQSAEELAADTAQRWRAGLAEWGQDGARIARLREAAEVVLYTPGSRSGRPISLLRSLAAPPPALRDDGDAFAAHLETTARGLLGLLDLDGDPLKSRDHLLLSTILRRAWEAGQELDLPTLIRQIQKPPFTEVGVLDLETFYPAKERAGLALAMNHLVASPSFAAWSEGEPLDIARLLHSEGGRPRLAVLSLAHLDDGQRSFFVTLLLSALLGWMRQQPGTTSLRALLYMDEIFGYFPPSAMPAPKRPMLTLLKQARAFGLGIVLATQNPVDIDYKGLGNCGTWFIGRLQTERDRARLVDGLAGAVAAGGRSVDRGALDRLLAGLGHRVFLMNDVHEDGPALFESRFTLSWLRGPLSPKEAQALARAALDRPAAAPATAPSPTALPAPVESRSRPLCPHDVEERFLLAPAVGGLLYRPGLYGTARLHYVSAKQGIDLFRPLSLLAPFDDATGDPQWGEATLFHAGPPALDPHPRDGARFAPAPPAALRSKSYPAWRKALAAHLYEHQPLRLRRSVEPKLVSLPDESEGDFRVRLSQLGHEARDARLDQLRQRYVPKFAALRDKIRRAEERAATQAAQYREQKVDTALSIGTSLLGAFLGRKVVTATNLGRARAAVRSTGRTARSRDEAARAQQEIALLEERLAALEAEFQREVDELARCTDAARLPLEELVVAPRKADLDLGPLYLAWVPFRITDEGTIEPAY